ncbi:hypothetical protein ABFT23_10455 [Nocardioides sp. C4-1]
MQNKLVKASLAGVAALAIAAGGSTFALWSDYDTLEGSQAGAEELSLVLDEPNSQNFDNMKLAPGVGNDYEFVVASRSGDTVPTASLKMALTNLVGQEDGCTSANSEADLDPNCWDMSSSGEFVEEARIIVNASAPSTDPDACSSAHPRGARQTSISLAGLANKGQINLLPTNDYLEKGEYICVSMGLNMPATASNASQGDSASFDFTFYLDQVI